MSQSIETPSMGASAAQRTGSGAKFGFREHLTFFDTDADQQITVSETFKGLSRLGFGRLASAPTAVLLHVGVTGLGLLHGRWLDPRALPLPGTSNLRHPDSRFVNDAGDFDEARLNELFVKHGQTFAGEALTVSELAELVASSLEATAREGAKTAWQVPLGAAAAIAEWGLLFWLADDRRDGVRVLEKETVRSFYLDPTFLTGVAQRIADRREARSHSRLGSARNLLQDWLI